MIYTGKLGSRTVAAGTPVIVAFADGQFLDFANLEEAKAFLHFYHRSPSGRARNPGNVYLLQGGVWVEEKLDH